MNPRRRNLLLYGGAWTPLALLSATLGSWWDPSDLSTMWQDSAGTTPAAVDQPVGRMVDKSRSLVVSQATSGSRPILRAGGGLYWLEFDGIDDTLVGVASAYGAIPAAGHYEAAALSRTVEANAYFLSYQNTSTVYHRLQNASTLTRGNSRTQDGTNTMTSSSASLSFPVSTVKVLDSLVLPAALDIGVNAVLVSAGGTWAGIGAATVNLIQITTDAKFYGAVTMQADPGAAGRARIQQYLASKGGISF